jgi:ribosomal protein S18 acetylase RimI-like enzyme
MVCDARGQVLAVGRVHDAGGHTAQIRYMAVETAHQRRGLGSLLLRELERAARGWGKTTIILHAREGAVPFYRRHGYGVVKPSHRVFREIRHYLMIKELPGCNAGP